MGKKHNNIPSLPHNLQFLSFTPTNFFGRKSEFNEKKRSGFYKKYSSVNLGERWWRKKKMLKTKMSTRRRRFNHLRPTLKLERQRRRRRRPRNPGPINTDDGSLTHTREGFPLFHSLSSRPSFVACLPLTCAIRRFMGDTKKKEIFPIFAYRVLIFSAFYVHKDPKFV